MKLKFIMIKYFYEGHYYLFFYYLFYVSCKYALNKKENIQQKGECSLLCFVVDHKDDAKKNTIG